MCESRQSGRFVAVWIALTLFRREGYLLFLKSVVVKRIGEPMFKLTIPGYGQLKLKHLVLDFNGTLARDGKLLDGVAEALTSLAGTMDIHVITADTFGSVTVAMEGIPCTVSILGEGAQAEGKLDYVQRLGSDAVVSIGNGRNDRLMLEAATVGIAVVEGEGAWGETVQAADIVCNSILDALWLFLLPKRLVATLRS